MRRNSTISRYIPAIEYGAYDVASPVMEQDDENGTHVSYEDCEVYAEQEFERGYDDGIDVGYDDGYDAGRDASRTFSEGDIKALGQALKDCKDHYAKMRNREPYPDEYGTWIVNYVND